jgi:uncharacterized sulfatase
VTRRRRIVLGALALLLVAAALAWANRIVLLPYLIGLRTDFQQPREPNRPVPWERGPAEASASPAARPPNIVLIVADDLGFNDVTTYGGGRADIGVPTPNIDTLAREGVRFDQGYSVAAVCTPSRAGLLTGRYPWRFGAEFTPTPPGMAQLAPMLYAAPGRIHPVIVDPTLAATAPDFFTLGMPGSERTIAELLAERGYHTIHIGKWHLGGKGDMLPNAQGFRESLNMEGLLYLPVDDPRAVNSRQDFDPIDRFLWPTARWAASFNDGKRFEPARHLTDWYTDEAVEAIRRNRNRPFFLYLAHWAVHTPLQATREDYDALPGSVDHRRRVYGGLIRGLDRSVGRVLQTLRDEGLDENTLVIFTSDNGAPAYIGLPEANRPYRGWKLTQFEGGVRVPLVARGPARIAPGQRFAAPVSGIDVLPTVAAAAGAALPADRPIDGIDLLPYLAEGAGEPAPRALFWRDGPYRAVRDGDWKLIVSERPKRDWLFDLASDPTERTDLSAARPEQVERLRGALQRHHAGMPPPRWQPFIQLPVLIDKTLEQPQSPDDAYTYWIN